MDVRASIFTLVNKHSKRLANLIYFHRSGFIEHGKFIISLVSDGWAICFNDGTLSMIRSTDEMNE